MQIRTKRAYEAPEPADGRRVLVDRLWPRGLKKTDAHLDAWHKEVAPSPELRKWFGHDPARWEEFKRRYLRELEANDAVDALLDEADGQTLTLIFSTRDELHNSAVVLKEHLEERGRRR